MAEIETIVGFKLPASARKHKEWWGNTAIPGRHSNAWIDSGWKSAAVDLGQQCVTFRRAGDARTASDASILPRATTPAKSPFDPAHLGDSDFAAECAVSVNLKWRRLGLLMLDAGKLRFPAAPKEAGIYRMIVRRGNRTTVYVGEAVSLYRRFGNYRNPGNTQQTSLRLNAFLREVLACDGIVAIDIAYEGITLAIGGKQTPVDLANKAIRRLIEQAAIVAHGGIDVDLLNL
ncbi:MAG TPA: hypothetical protein VJ846_01215 [Sphingomicrobium sp.]|nr:hypothetical protein [Sphingomicrobium sp.]